MCSFLCHSTRAHRGAIALLIAVSGALACSAQQADSLATSPAPLAADTTTAGPHSPKRALLKSLVVPGWGQIYNHQWYKAPFVYAAIGGVTAMALNNAGQHRQARNAFLYATGIGQDPNPYQRYEADFNRFPGATADRLFDYKNSLRRNRDLSFFAIGVVYALNVLDAYISAHLVDFDVDADLAPDATGASPSVFVSIRISPRTLIP